MYVSGHYISIMSVRLQLFQSSGLLTFFLSCGNHLALSRVTSKAGPLTPHNKTHLLPISVYRNLLHFQFKKRKFRSRCINGRVRIGCELVLHVNNLNRFQKRAHISSTIHLIMTARTGRTQQCLCETQS